MSRSVTDSRQVTLREFLEQIASASHYAGTTDAKPANQTELDNLLRAIDDELTPPLRLDASSPNDLVVSVGAAVITNSESARSRSIPHIGALLPNSFSSGTVTFPATSGGTITVSPGNNGTLTVPSNEYIKVLIYMDATGALNVLPGVADAVEANASVLAAPKKTLPIGYVTLFNNAGTIDNIAQSKIYQFGSGGGAGASGSGAGGINYILNTDAETDATGYSLYNDTPAASAPIDGTGGSANITFTRNTSSPLRGDADFLITKDAVNRQGEGVSCDFTIDEADLASVLRVSFDYKTSASYADGDIRVYAYDVTNSTLIELSQRDLAATSLNSQYIGEFQTSATGTSYRLIIHVSSTNASAYTVNLDNVQVGPREIARGSVITNWEAFTPTGSWNTNTTYSGYKRRVGDQAEYWVLVSLTGAPNATNLSINIPDGTINTSKLALGSLNQFGDGNIRDSSPIAQYPAIIVYNTTSSVSVRYSTVLGSNLESGNAVSNTDPITFASGDNIVVKYSVPISGWSSDAVLSSDFGNRLIAARYTHSAGSAIANNGIIDFANQSYDLTASVTTGGSWAFTAPKTGYYRVVAQAFATDSLASSSYFEISLRINGSLYAAGDRFTRSGTASNVTSKIATTIPLTKGQTVDIINSSGTTRTLLGNGNYNYITIDEVQSPQSLLGGETVAASAYRGTSNQTIVTSATVAFNAKTVDTHGTFNTSTGIYTIPLSGIYKVNVTVAVDNISGVDPSIVLRRSGSIVATNYAQRYVQTTTGGVSTINFLLNCNQGDTIDVISTGDASYDILFSGTQTFISIEKIN